MLIIFSKAYAKKKEICCSGKIYNRRLYGCCANEAFQKAKFYCCGDAVEPRTQDPRRCCGKSRGKAVQYDPSNGESCCANNQIGKIFRFHIPLCFLELTTRKLEWEIDSIKVAVSV